MDFEVVVVAVVVGSAGREAAAAAATGTASLLGGDSVFFSIYSKTTLVSTNEGFIIRVMIKQDNSSLTGSDKDSGKISPLTSDDTRVF